MVMFLALIVFNFMLTMVATDLFLYSSHRFSCIRIFFRVLFFVRSFFFFFLLWFRFVFITHSCLSVRLFLWNRCDWNDKIDINENRLAFERNILFFLFIACYDLFLFVLLPLRKYRKCMRRNVIAVQFSFRKIVCVYCICK